MTDIIYDSVQHLDDVNALTEIMLRAISEQPFTVRVKNERVKALALRLYHRDPTIRHLLAKVDGALAAYFIWTEQEDLLTGERLHREISLYVVPEYRGSTGGRISQHFFNAVTRGASKVVCTVPDAQIRTLEQRGFVKFGNAMLLEVGA